MNEKISNHLLDIGLVDLPMPLSMCSVKLIYTVVRLWEGLRQLQIDFTYKNIYKVYFSSYLLTFFNNPEPCSQQYEVSCMASIWQYNDTQYSRDFHNSKCFLNFWIWILKMFCLWVNWEIVSIISDIFSNAYLKERIYLLLGENAVQNEFERKKLY